MEKAGHECIGYVEKDKFACKSYEAMYDTKGELKSRKSFSIVGFLDS